MKIRISAILTCFISLVLTVETAPAQTKAYVPKNGILNLKSVFLGGGFRVSTAIPLHGNFSKYDRLDIVRPESLIGPDIPPGFLEKLGNELQAEFKKGGRFVQVAIVDSFEQPRVSSGPPGRPANDFREADALETPIRGMEDLHTF